MFCGSIIRRRSPGCPVGTVETTMAVSGITGFRLEAMEDPGLPNYN